MKLEVINFLKPSSLMVISCLNLPSFTSKWMFPNKCKAWKKGRMVMLGASENNQD
jgi:uncharacterized membrane protein YoaT (DUF817 family)